MNALRTVGTTIRTLTRLQLVLTLLGAAAVGMAARAMYLQVVNTDFLLRRLWPADTDFADEDRLTMHPISVVQVQVMDDPDGSTVHGIVRIEVDVEQSDG